MSNISERQISILKHLIEEYVRTAEPVSSRALCERFNLDVSPATVRIELGSLGEKGYVIQPHTSAGRVPADKGYRFFVDRLDKGEDGEEDFEEIVDVLEKDLWRRVSKLARFIADNTSVFALSGLPSESFFAGAGWEHVLEQPEFEENRVPARFAQLVKRIEKDARKWQKPKDIKVYIGKENPFGRFNEFSVLLTSCSFEQSEGIVVLAGPKRMPYWKNIRVLKKIKRWLSDKHEGEKRENE